MQTINARIENCRRNCITVVFGILMLVLKCRVVVEADTESNKAGKSCVWVESLE